MADIVGDCGCGASLRATSRVRSWHWLDASIASIALEAHRELPSAGFGEPADHCCDLIDMLGRRGVVRTLKGHQFGVLDAERKLP